MGGFAKAVKAAELPFQVTPHIFRGLTVMYLGQKGFADSDLMKVTGHAYDKSSREENASRRVRLVF